MGILGNSPKLLSLVIGDDQGNCCPRPTGLRQQFLGHPRYLGTIIWIVILSCKILEFDWLRNMWQKILLPHRVPKSHPPSNNSWQQLTMHDNG